MYFYLMHSRHFLNAICEKGIYVNEKEIQINSETLP